MAVSSIEDDPAIPFLGRDHREILAHMTKETWSWLSVSNGENPKSTGKRVDETH